ncbi:MAG TPA: hypothetical protein VOA78_14420 [Candidatus Dormibacteraeota bacterium]|nr:hypothetical protein [Candidatus Dormibacteraeota bacterium]
MATKRTVRITIETERLLVIRHGASVREWCQQCATEVDMVPLESAAEVGQVAAGVIQRLLDNERLHLSNSSGLVRICLNSLFRELA